MIVQCQLQAGATVTTGWLDASDPRLRVGAWVTLKHQPAQWWRITSMGRPTRRSLVHVGRDDAPNWSNNV